jgi:hypothetical protein
MAYIDVDIDEFLNSCSSWDIKELIKALVEDGHIPEEQVKETKIRASFVEQEHIDACKKLMDAYHRLSNEDTDLIKKLSEKV